MGRPDFGQPTTHSTLPVAHALHDDAVDVVGGDIVEGVHDRLLVEVAIEPEPALPLGCRWRLPLTWVHNSSGVLLLYRDQLDVHTLDQVMVYVNVDGSIVI